MSFKEVDLKRGFYEIEKFFDICQRYDSVICGGYARYCASPLPTKKVVIPGDVDIFSHSDISIDDLLNEFISIGYKKMHENNLSITLEPEDEKKIELEIFPIPQIIKPIREGKIISCGTNEELLENFDFSITRAAILSPTTVLVDEDFEEDERRKILRLKNIHCPISSMIRCCKYAKKGYFIRPMEALKLFKEWDIRGEDYRNRMIELFDRSDNNLTRDEIDELEALLRVD